MTDVPHFSLPFRFGAPNAAVSEQDSVDEIADCVYAIVACPLGFRVELPEFGTTDPTFSSPAPHLDTIRSAIETWEPRAAVALSQLATAPGGSPEDELTARIETIVSVRTEE